jgi:hypothetical protein
MFGTFLNGSFFLSNSKMQTKPTEIFLSKEKPMKTNPILTTYQTGDFGVS